MPFVTLEEELALALRVKQGDPRALDQLVKAHLRLVFSITREFERYGVALEELVSEGILGLVEAVRRFEPEHGARLSTYAGWWIRGYLRRFTMANRRIVRAPSSRHGRELFSSLRRTQRELSQQAGAPARAEDVAVALGMRVSEVQEMEEVLSARDVTCGHGQDAMAGEPRSMQPSPEVTVMEAQQQRRSSDAVAHALRLLNSRERMIVSQRLLAEDPRSLACLGEELGVSRERVRQLEQKACSTLRKTLGVFFAGAGGVAALSA
jgi:RNA polymerase sigma-32 factor